MQAAGEQLLSQVTQSIMGICTGLQLQEIQPKLSEVISDYDIKRIEPEHNHPDVQEKIDMFIAGKQLEGLSKTTLKDYKIKLRKFPEQVKKKVEDITTNDIRQYLSQYAHQKRTTQSGKLSVLKSFFGWLAAEDILPKDPTAKIKPPKKEKRLPKALNIEELELLRESCHGVRQRMLLESLYATGCRLDEVHKLNRDDVDFQTMSCKVVGKGDKEREVYFSYKAMYHLKKYLLSRTDDCPALIITERKPYRRLSHRGIQREIRMLVTNSGLQKKVSPHTLRHTFATLTLNNGAELVAVQELLGHENPATTQIYASISAERKREQHKKHLVQ